MSKIENTLKIEKNISLAKFTTFRLGGLADFLVRIKNLKELLAAFQFAKKNNLSFFVFSGGSNILFSDQGFRGLLIKMENDYFAFKANQLSIESGFNLAKLVNICALKGFDLSFLAGIYGSVGGAIFSNAGTSDGEISTYLKSVEIFDTKTEKRIIKTKKELNFSYRQSIFHKKKHWIIYKANFVFNHKKSSAEILKQIKKNLLQRNKKQPFGFSAGSFFKNPSGFSAGYLIEKSGLKGLSAGKAIISLQHGNFIINKGKASSFDVITLAKKIYQKIKQDFSINLEPEVRILDEQGKLIKINENN